MVTTAPVRRARTGERFLCPQAVALLKLRFHTAVHGLGAADSAVVVPLLQQTLERYKIDSTLIFAGSDAVAASMIGPVISTSWPTWKFNMS